MLQKTSGEPLFNLGMQQYQPTSQACCTDPGCEKSCIALYLGDGLLYNGACLRVAATSLTHSRIFHRYIMLRQRKFYFLPRDYVYFVKQANIFKIWGPRS